MLIELTVSYSYQDPALFANTAFSAYLTAYVSPRWKIIMGLLLTILIPLLTVIGLMIITEEVNISPDARTFELFLLGIIASFLPCLLGAFIGFAMPWVTLKNSDNK